MLFYDPKTASLEEAKAWLRERVDKGSNCPCCQQFAKVYRRKITSAMAAALIHFMKADRRVMGQWLQLETFFRHINAPTSFRGDFAKLVYWGMVEERQKEEGDDVKRTSGMWRITPTGRDFAHARITVPQYAFVYNGKVLRFGPGHVSIRESLAHKFNYQELMA